jgi:hypothetical protein
MPRFTERITHIFVRLFLVFIQQPENVIKVLSYSVRTLKPDIFQYEESKKVSQSITYITIKKQLRNWSERKKMTDIYKTMTLSRVHLHLPSLLVCTIVYNYFNKQERKLIQ